MTQPVLEARGLVKTFGHVIGLAGVDLQLHAGEVLAIIGDNGAGKTTIIKCLSGAMTPDAGTMLVDGREMTFRSTQEAREAVRLDENRAEGLRAGLTSVLAQRND